MHILDSATKVLVLGGGNALGAYQAGAYQALAEGGFLPHWVVGASIGAVNGAIIAGNAPEQRVAQLRAFWTLAEQFDKQDASAGGTQRLPVGPKNFAALQTLVAGRPGLFHPRLPGFWSILPLLPADISLFDTRPAVTALQGCLDWQMMNEGPVRLTASAVDVESGERLYFDTARTTLTVEHLRASVAFPVLFPPVSIDSRTFVDPGLVENLPLPAVFADRPRDLVCLAFDLAPLAGAVPQSIGEALARAQDILLGGQSRRCIAQLLEDARQSEGAAALVVHVVYGDQQDEGAGKTLDYSGASIRARWARGYRDAAGVLDFLRGAPARDSLRCVRFENGCVTDYQA